MASAAGSTLTRRTLVCELYSTLRTGNPVAFFTASIRRTTSVDFMPDHGPLLTFITLGLGAFKTLGARIRGILAYMQVKPAVQVFEIVGFLHRSCAFSVGCAGTSSMFKGIISITSILFRAGSDRFLL